MRVYIYKNLQQLSPLSVNDPVGPDRQPRFSLNFRFLARIGESGSLALSIELKKKGDSQSRAFRPQVEAECVLLSISRESENTKVKVGRQVGPTGSRHAYPHFTFGRARESEKSAGSLCAMEVGYYIVGARFLFESLVGHHAFTTVGRFRYGERQQQSSARA